MSYTLGPNPEFSKRLPGQDKFQPVTRLQGALISLAAKHPVLGRIAACALWEVEAGAMGAVINEAATLVADFPPSSKISGSAENIDGQTVYKTGVIFNRQEQIHELKIGKDSIPSDLPGVDQQTPTGAARLLLHMLLHNVEPGLIGQTSIIVGREELIQAGSKSRRFGLTVGSNTGVDMRFNGSLVSN